MTMHLLTHFEILVHAFLIGLVIGLMIGIAIGTFVCASRAKDAVQS